MLSGTEQRRHFNDTPLHTQKKTRGSSARVLSGYTSGQKGRTVNAAQESSNSLAGLTKMAYQTTPASLLDKLMFIDTYKPDV